MEFHRQQLTLVDLANVGYKDDPWVLAERVAQVFYIADPMNVKKHKFSTLMLRITISSRN
jgi:hypothetical protein